MTLDEFIEMYDRPGVVLLFFGKRNIPLREAVKVRKLAILLASKTQQMVFRSGHAKGTDEAFEVGVAEVDIDRIELILPNSGHRKKERQGYNFRSLDDLILVNEDHVILWAKKHSISVNLVNRYVEGIRDRLTHKVAPIIRDAVMVIGHENIVPTTIALYWDDPNNSEDGGTGFTIRILKENKIASYGQDVWEEWL
jgi:hypothetical protein